MDKGPIDALARTICTVLARELPKQREDWWRALVFGRLTFQQQSHAEQNKAASLDDLDLAALLRVLNENWYELARPLDLGPQVRNWLKEAQSIRNRWAHSPAAGIDRESHYRDLDTLERLQVALGAHADDVSGVRRKKRELMAGLAGGIDPTIETSMPAVVSALFKLGDVVHLKANSSVTGAVVAHLPGDSEDRFQVFLSGAITTYYASQLELASLKPGRTEVLPDLLHAALSALQLRHPSTNHLYSLFASRIQFVPYQFRPVLKFIQADRPRLLIADEVGVGKTIEAGLILKELHARQDLKSVLVICPKPLVAERKWLEEMKRFDELFEHLDSASLRYCINETDSNGVWPQRYSRVILPYSLLDEALMMGEQHGRKRRHGLLELDPPPAFDLVIVDEAHHVRNTETWAYRNVRYFCENAEAVIMLSATPIQLESDDLFNLLNLLRPDILPDRQTFDQMSEPNPHINEAIEAARSTGSGWRKVAKASIDRALSTAWGRRVLALDPRTQEIYDYLNSEHEDPAIRLLTIRQLEELYTFSTLINRTRRRDIGGFTTRSPETVAVEFTEEQMALHADLISLIGRILVRRHGDKNLLFMMTTIRRQAASCVFGLAPLLESILRRHISKIEVSEMDGDVDMDEASEALSGFQAEVESLIKRARTLDKCDPKLDAFLKVIRDKQALPNNKLLVFSTFRHTLAYLSERLAAESIRVGLIHGDVPDAERRELRRRFSLEKGGPHSLDVLLSSEVGCEGLDFQFCDALVNYDLPWNPMRVEQRIGRIDRFGQKSEKVVIYNLITPGTVDFEIFDRCLMRIGVFKQAIGGSEEVLGQLTRQIRSIAENFALTEGERTARLQQLADNEIRFIQEQTKLEEQQEKLFGLNLPKQGEDLLKKASNFWISPMMLANLTERYLRKIEPTKSSPGLGRKSVSTIQCSKEARDFLLADFEALSLSGSVAQEWRRWLKGSDQHLAVTFDTATATDRRDVAFITPTHPLARQAALSMEPAMPLSSCSEAIADGLPEGRYPYAIYRWKKLGIKEDFTFQPVCGNQAVAERILELLASAKPATASPPLSSNEEDSLEKNHYGFWRDARAAHIEQISEYADSRLNSLHATHAARLALLEEQRDNASHSNIVRMRQGQIEAANREYALRARDLGGASLRADIVAEPVAFGILNIRSQ